MIGRYDHITFLAVSRSESDEAYRPRRRLSASVYLVLSAVTALVQGLWEAQYPSCASSWQLCQFVTTRDCVSNQQCVLMRSGSAVIKKRVQRPYTSFSEKNTKWQGNMLHTVERANSWARLRCEARPKDSKWDRTARREGKKGALLEVSLMSNYLIWGHRGLTFCWHRRFRTSRCPRLLPPDLSHPDSYLSALRAPHWAHATADGDAASHQTLFAGLRLARTGELSTKAFGKRYGHV